MLRGIKDERQRAQTTKSLICPPRNLHRFAASLPYQLTGAQKRVLGEIIRDLRSPVPMNRLVQGDVGSGKTALALAVMYLAACEGRQGALMAPTEILAAQHYQSLKQTLEPLDIGVGMLTGSLKGREKREALENIRSGKWQVVTGTHALIETAVEFRDLALVVTDEQHRFGVRQLSALRGKGDAPHMLVMSATPVPRTLALLLYGDLDVSVVDEQHRNN
jgi:ATP-dependent DNA helicase RecG